MSATPPNPKKRKNFSIKDKIEIIDKVKKGHQRTSLCNEYGIPESTLRGWLKDEEKIRGAISQMDEPDSKRRRIKGAKDKQLDEAVLTWFTQARSEGMPVSGTNIQDQAMKYHKMLHPNDDTFTGSKGWLRNFKDRHAIRQVTIHGEQRSADEAAASSYPPQLRKIIEDGGYSPEQIYNADETALYFKMLPAKTLAQKSDTTKTLGFKQNKNRLTALLATNASGRHKLKPLIIGKFENPRCLHHVNRKALPTHYDFSRNAWMTAGIFEKWFHDSFVPEVKKHLRQQGLEPKAVLLVDNCAAHPVNLKSRNGKIMVSFLPKNTTSKIQPLDMGVISTTKRNYRRNLVQAIIDSQLSLTDYVKQLNIKDAMNLFAASWEEVTGGGIRACWMKALGSAFTTVSQDDNSDEEFDGFTSDDLRQAEERATGLEAGFSAADIISARGGSSVTYRQMILKSGWRLTTTKPTTSFMTDDEIVNKVHLTGSSDANYEDNEDDDEIEQQQVTAMSIIVRGLEAGLEFEQSEVSTSADVLHLNNILRKARRKAREGKRQAKMTEFFLELLVSVVDCEKSRFVTVKFQ